MPPTPRVGGEDGSVGRRAPHSPSPVARRRILSSLGVRNGRSAGTRGHRLSSLGEPSARAVAKTGSFASHSSSDDGVFPKSGRGGGGASSSSYPSKTPTVAIPSSPTSSISPSSASPSVGNPSPTHASSVLASPSAGPSSTLASSASMFS